MTNQSHKTRDIKSWLHKSVLLNDVSLSEVYLTIIEIISNQGFRITNKIDNEDQKTIKALYGSRIIAFLLMQISEIGKHVPWGKRLGLDITVSKGESVNLSIKVVPYMELLNSSEVSILTQTPIEKATDEYFAAKKVFNILLNLHQKLNLPLPEDIQDKFDYKTCTTDIMLGLIIYPLDGYNASKKIHFPIEKGPKWNWNAFLLPEIWFMWHEIWGPSLIAIFISFWAIMMFFPTHYYIFPAILFSFRILFGFTGNRLYYYRYGHWVGQKKKKN